jgi:3-methyladenine DNA glycosylase AlkC
MLLKDMYNPDSLREFAVALQAAYAPFSVEEFLEAVFDETWEDLELKARGRQINLKMAKFLPQDYAEALAVLDKVAAKFDGFFGIILNDFVEVFGQNESDWDLSIAAMENFTKYSSAEFAVRPFIIKHEARMMAQMAAWAGHENEHVRRLASEGCRPALPWGQALPSFKRDPMPVLPILERLKADPSAYVRKSVANNLNDISKTHPDLVAGIARQWYGENPHTDWIVKHACRTLLKKGNRDVLAIFGFDDSESSVKFSDFALDSASVAIGGELGFSFAIKTEKALKVRLEYGIDYMKANGKRNRKIFQISELALKMHERKTYTKRQSFADLSTRRHYPGLHSITIIVNGTERGTLDFELTKC